VTDRKGYPYRAAFTRSDDGRGELKETEVDSVEDVLRNAGRGVRPGYKPIGIRAPARGPIHGAAAIRDLRRRAVT